MRSESAHRTLADLYRNGAGFDLGQVDNVVDEVEEVRSRRMDRPRELGLLLVEVALRIVGEELREDQQRIQWRAKLVTHVREERSEEHTSELQSLMRISYAVFCLKKKKTEQEVNECK